MSEPTTPKPKNRTSVPFIISLCLNVALMAMIAVVIAANLLRPPRPPWSGGPLGPYALMAAAEPAERTRIQAVVERHKARIRDLTRQATQARLVAFDLFARQQFHASDYMNALDRVRLSNDALQAEVSKLMTESAAQLSPQERAGLAEKAREFHKGLWRAWRFRGFRQ
jgi:uncharacterized membrane protein